MDALNINTLSPPSRGRGLFLLLLFLALTACTTADVSPPEAPDWQHDWQQDTQQWRERREARLQEPFGWLSLVGLEQLRPGITTLGSSEDMGIVVPGGPAHWGNLIFEDETVRFITAPGTDVTVDGQALETAVLEAGGESGPTLVEASTLQFHLIDRGGPWVRVRDSQAPTRINFAGLDWFEIDPAWRIEAEFIPHPESTSIDIANVLGEVGPAANPGQARFEHDGRAYALEAVDAEDQLWFIIADRTSGRETYGLGRFLYADLPVEGRVILDFNRAYNPPCVFTDYSTCPLPPLSNRLDLHVTAGERNYPGPLQP